MPLLPDSKERKRLTELLSRWREPRAVAWTDRPKRELWSDLPGLNMELVNQAMYEHARTGGDINRVEERNPTQRELHDCWYEFRILVNDEKVYAKLKMMPDTGGKSGPELFVMSFHKGWEKT